MKNNVIDQHDEILPFFADMKDLLCLYIKGNPAMRKVSQFRKNMILNMPKLYYLDDRPIFEIERLCADAFVRGGKEEEKKVREEYQAK